MVAVVVVVVVVKKEEAMLMNWNGCCLDMSIYNGRD